MLAEAESWVAAGYSVLPIRHRDKRPDATALRWADSLNSDGSPTWNTYKQRQASSAELRLWFDMGPRHNIGLVTGYNGLVVVDFDDMDAYHTWLQLCTSLGHHAGLVASATYRVQTARGMHVYVRVAEMADSYSVGRIDVKARWGYVLTAPSVHPRGHVYTAIPGPICEVAHLADILPLEPTAPVVQPTPTAPHYDDPYESAEHAQSSIESGAVAHIKAHFTIPLLLGITMGGRDWVRTSCPLHDDHKPSLVIYADDHCTCLAGCGKQMDVIELYAAINGLTNRDAIARLVEQVM